MNKVSEKFSGPGRNRGKGGRGVKITLTNGTVLHRKNGDETKKTKRKVLRNGYGFRLI